MYRLTEPGKKYQVGSFHRYKLIPQVSSMIFKYWSISINIQSEEYWISISISMRKKLKYQYSVSVSFRNPNHLLALGTKTKIKFRYQYCSLNFFYLILKFLQFVFLNFFHAFCALFLRFARAYRVIMKLLWKFSEFL